MAKNFGRVNVSITASTGGLTAGLARAGKQLQGFRASASGSAGTVDQLNGALGDSAGFFSDVPGLFGSFASALLGVSRSAGIATIGIRVLTLAIRTLLVPLGIIAAITAPFRAFANAASELDEAGKSASRLGMSMTTFQNLSQVANEAGVSMGQLTGLLTVMSRGLGNLATGSASAQKAFGRLGLAMADLAGMSPERQFELISQRIMALPTAAERTAAAMAIFGRQGASAMGLIADASTGAVSEIAKLREQLGLNLTDAQVSGIEMMNDAVGRLSLVFGGFINQFVAELAPAIATVANLFVKFFAENTSGWTIATSLANGLGHAIRGIAAAITFLYGLFQVLSSFVGVFIQGALTAFEGVTWAIQNTIAVMARAAEALPGFDVGLASSLRAAERSMAALGNAAGQEAAIWGTAAADNFADGIRNMSDPFAAFDAEFASVTDQMQAAGAAAGQAAGSGIASQITASTKSLKAIVVGTSEGEAFRNQLARGYDPRRDGDPQKETAANTGEMVDQLDELNASLASSGGFGVATIGV